MPTYMCAGTGRRAPLTRRWSWRSGTRWTGTTLAIDVIDRVPRLAGAGAHLKEWLKGQIIESVQYADTEGVDRKEIRDWKWGVG